MSNERKAPTHTTFMRRQAVAFELGVSRHTLARMLEKDKTMPRFFAISPGIEVCERAEFDAWVEQRKLAARLLRLTATNQSTPGQV